MRRMTIGIALTVVSLFSAESAQSQVCLKCTAAVDGQCLQAPASAGYWLCNDRYCYDALCSMVGCKVACPCTFDLSECEGGGDGSPFDPPIIRAKPFSQPVRTVAVQAMLWRRTGAGDAPMPAPRQPVVVGDFNAERIAEAIAQHTGTSVEDWAVTSADISYAPSGRPFGFLTSAGDGYVIQVVPQGGGALVVVRAPEAGRAGRRLASGHVARDQVLLAPVEIAGEPMFLAVRGSLLPEDEVAVAADVAVLRQTFADGLRAYPRKQGRQDLEVRLMQ